VKRPEEAMEILEAYDLTGSLRGAATLAGCDHKTVARLVAAREAAGGGLPGRAARPALVMVEPFAGRVAELVDHSHAHRADKAHGVLVAMGYEGSYRTTRRAVAEAKQRWRQKHGRRMRPWIPQPGKWLQWDYGDGPENRERIGPCLDELVVEDGVVRESVQASRDPDGSSLLAVYLVPFHRAERSLAAGMLDVLNTGQERLPAFAQVDWQKARGWLRTRTGKDLAPASNRR